jgi:RNase P subunit RPR2
MEPRIFHGNIIPRDLARALMAEYNRGNLRAQVIGNEQHMIVQISTPRERASGGQTAMSVTLKKVADGVSVELGQQAWLGVAASLGQTLLSAWHSPWNLLSRLDDLAQDYESIQLSQEVWRVIETTARSSRATFELSERLRRITCEYCQTANPVGAQSCIACGAPLGAAQPTTCFNCGFVVSKNEKICPNCGQKLSPK